MCQSSLTRNRSYKTIKASRTGTRIFNISIKPRMTQNGLRECLLTIELLYMTLYLLKSIYTRF